MKRYLQLTVLLLTLSLLVGCDDIAKQFGSQKPVSTKHQSRIPTPPHRFVLAQGHTDIAFDTQTGQLCRTWDWAPVAPEQKPSNGLIPQRLPGELTPTCLSLFTEYPGMSDPNDQLGLFQDPNPK
jgi:hypothetical protein